MASSRRVCWLIDDEAEQRWEYRIHFTGGGALGGAPLALWEVLDELRRSLSGAAVARVEIKPYDDEV